MYSLNLRNFVGSFNSLGLFVYIVIFQELEIDWSICRTLLERDQWQHDHWSMIIDHFQNTSGTRSMATYPKGFQLGYTFQSGSLTPFPHPSARVQGSSLSPYVSLFLYHSVWKIAEVVASCCSFNAVSLLTLPLPLTPISQLVPLPPTQAHKTPDQQDPHKWQLPYSVLVTLAIKCLNSSSR